MRYLLAFSLLLFLQTGCKKSDNNDNHAGNGPTACIGYVSEVFAQTGVTLQNCSSGADTYLWDFADGTTSTAAAPYHTWSAAGTYNVTLTVTGGGGTHTTSRTITVQNADEINYNPGGYSRVYLSHIEVISYPQYDQGGNYWDGPSDYPDLCVYVLDVTNGDLYSTQSNYKPNVAPGAHAVWDLSSQPREFSFPSNGYKFRLRTTLLDADDNGTFVDLQTMASTIDINLFAPQYYGQSDATITQGNYSIKLSFIWQ